MLGERICSMRTSLGWSQVELAKRLGVAKQTVSNWENDNIQPSIEMLIRISMLLGVSTDYLLGLDAAPRISVEGLSPNFVAHLLLLIEDYKAK
ncbi:MAG: helix-turn-helix transcriptional regulator [Oscillospiraceae bacterium]|nr:helix-turn-helix transcriptional regulator [Clostridia bacterium]MBR4056940.1 helix-turn-helix transcriptional regulator [Oscillospiraceae bacterium]